MRAVSFLALFCVVGCAPSELSPGASDDGSDQAADTGFAVLPGDQLAPPTESFPGALCGLSYDQASPAFDFPCGGVDPTAYGSGVIRTIFGVSFRKDNHGDFGMAAGQGFESFTATSGRYTNASTVPVGRGATCGFGHTRNTPNVECFSTPVVRSFAVGSPPQLSCPAGWSGRSYQDMGSNGHFWYWCEKNASAAVPDLYPGYTCGVHGTGTVAYCGGTAVSNTCPAGYNTLSFHDRGRSAGQGLMACVMQ